MRVRRGIVWSALLGGAVLGVLAGLDRMAAIERAEEGTLERLARSSAPAPDVAAPPRPIPDAAAPESAGDGDESVPAAAPPPRRILYLNDIDDIKHEIYAREIESVDRLHLLDDLVQTGDRDTRELWNRDWSGVDDWKRERNGFTLQQAEDGSLIFHPDQATMDLYTFYETLQAYEYDEATHEFVNEVDYYGKPIRNVLKFIDENTLVMMTISGDKVDLNIYGEGAPEE